VLELGLTDNRVMEPLRHLTQEIGPRLTGSANLERACAWAQVELAALGLDARLERWGEIPVGFDRGPAGCGRGGMVAPEAIPYELTTFAWTPGTGGPVRGPARAFPRSAEELEAHADLYRGAWIVWLTRPEMPPLAAQAELEERLLALGAAGFVRGGGNEVLVTVGDHAVDPDDLPRKVEVRVIAEQHVDLLARLARGEEVELSFEVDNRFRPGPIQLHNVVADLRGVERPDEVVIVGAHLDSWDGAEGAQDDGTGVATTLEAARLLVAAGARPRRTIRFVLWTGSEQGLLGSTAYVAQNPDLLPRISAVLVHDGGTNYVSGIAGPEPLLADLERAFLPVMHLDLAMPFDVVPNDGLPRDGGSDHVPFVRAGVPAFFWRHSGETNYARFHHTQHDVLAHVRADYLRHSAIVVAVGAYDLARLENLLDRTDLLAPQPRKLGAYLDGTTVSRLIDGKALAAGWRPGDVVLSVDGAPVTTREELIEAVRTGPARQAFRLRRGEEELEAVIDWSAPPAAQEGEEGGPP
jgi:hypothetical protein